ncbi:hypothetical protein ACFZAM_16035 [Streptomyces sp. NPDC008079]|uniref:hypothetical protein n=1 Tax=Streptomyces sp. NPDC008079 TaxID=3364806 RepID=UPI0036E5E153
MPGPRSGAAAPRGRDGRPGIPWPRAGATGDLAATGIHPRTPTAPSVVAEPARRR